MEGSLSPDEAAYPTGSNDDAPTATNLVAANAVANGLAFSYEGVCLRARVCQ